MGTNDDRGPVKATRTTLLVAAIGGIVIGLLWYLTYAGVIVALPLWVLAGFQFAERKKLAASHDPASRASAVFRLGVWTLISGLFNAIGLICGIVLLSLHGQLRLWPAGDGGRQAVE